MRRLTRITLSIVLSALWITQSHVAGQSMEPVIISEDGKAFILASSKKPFKVWGVNYDHDSHEPDSRLIEDYWIDEWQTVVDDFQEMKELGANVIRIHLQIGRFMSGPQTANQRSLAQLGKLLDLAESTGLYLDITGLGCYHKADIPEWYDSMNERERWNTQASFWTFIATACKESNAVFCYDLMNEPVIGDGSNKDWLGGELGGKYFVQKITLDKGKRSPQQTATEWIELLTTAIRKTGARQLITVGVIPWSQIWPEAKPVFYSPEASHLLDFVSIHLYPKSGELKKAIDAMKVYEIGKPLLIEETFPLSCTMKEMDDFIFSTKARTAGYISFYWGKTAGEYSIAAGADFKNVLMSDWLGNFKNKAPLMKK